MIGLPPRLLFSGLPEEEKNATWLLSISLSDLDKYVNDFGAALSLFDFCATLTHATAPTVFRRWPLVAGRDGAMTIYHFGKALHNIRAALGACPTTNKRVAPSILRTATKRFESHFPTFEKLRNAVAHAADLAKNEQNFERNAFSGSYAGPGIQITDSHNVMLGEGLLDRQFTKTVDGQIVSYEISQATLDRLISIKNEFWATFREAESESMTAVTAAHRPSASREPDEPPD